YEWTPEREREMLSTIPYYVYRLRLVVRSDNTAIRGWADLRNQPRRPRVGVLRGSSAHRFLEREYADAVDIEALAEDGSTGGMLKVNRCALAATGQDEPAVAYYVGEHNEFPQLKAVDEAVEPGYYVIFVRRNSGDLRDRLDGAIREAMESGKLKEIYERNEIWNAEQEKLPEAAKNWPPPVTGPA